MSPGILEIAKAKGDDEEDYLEIEIYKDLEGGGSSNYFLHSFCIFGVVNDGL